MGCKTDLREDEQIIEELKKENMVPVSFEEVRDKWEEGERKGE